MKQQELNTLLNFIQKQNSPEADELTSIVLKMASDIPPHERNFCIFMPFCMAVWLRRGF